MILEAKASGGEAGLRGSSVQSKPEMGGSGGGESVAGLRLWFWSSPSPGQQYVHMLIGCFQKINKDPNCSY
jgi:hypothetical protein